MNIFRHMYVCMDGWMDEWMYTHTRMRMHARISPSFIGDLDHHANALILPRRTIPTPVRFQARVKRIETCPRSEKQGYKNHYLINFWLC